MVEKSSGQTFESIMLDLRAGKFSPIYILMGEEGFFIDKITDFIAENAIKPEERDFNQDIVFGNDVTVSKIIDIARGYPMMMASRRVVIVKEAQNLKRMDLLEKYLENPVKSTVLVICYKNGTVDKRKKFMSFAQANGVVFESKKKRDSDLPSFVIGYLKKKKIDIDSKASSMIAENIGNDLNRITSELDKLLIALPEDKKMVTADMVEKQIGVSKDFNIFELKNAIIGRDVYKANEILKYFDNNPKSGGVFQTPSTLFGYFQNLMVAYYCPNKWNEKSLSSFLGLKSFWSAKEYIIGMRNYSGIKCMQIIQKIRETDAKMKGLDNVSATPGELVKELIFFILH